MSSDSVENCSLYLIISKRVQPVAFTDILISEYIEGSSFNKAIELYNGTATSVDLSTGLYTLELYSNGSSTPNSTLSLTGTIASEDVFVIANSQADPAILAVQDLLNNTVINFNGDDAIVLKKNGVILDSIGQVGFDPGSEWGSGLTSTADNTLRRLSTVMTGDTHVSDTFNPAVEWEGFASNTFDGLGSYTTGGGGDPTFALIHAIQGTSDTSNTGTYDIEAIVTGVFNGTSGLGGFYVQEEDADWDTNPLTSEGLFVFSNTAVSVGDKVQITGTVVEQFGQTQMNPSGVTVVGTDVLPSATPVSFPIATVSDLEQYEGMRVQVQAASGDLTVTEHFNFDRFGEVLLSSGGRLEQFTQNNAPSVSGYTAHLEEVAQRSILIDDGRNGQNLFPILNARGGNNLTPSNTLRGGDTVAAVEGILGYGFSNYRVQPTESIDYQASNPRPANAPNVGGNLEIASFNLLNYFNGDGAGGGFPTSRGATTFSDFQRQTAKLVTTLNQLDADIIGVQELENDYGEGENSAIENLLDELNAVSSRNYTYVNPGVAQLGGDEIAVGIIYDANVVAEVGTAAFLNTAGIFDGVNTSRAPLAQTFAIIDANNPDLGEEFTLAVNHFKSKGGTGTGADADAGDGQGNWNQRRLEAADALTTWLATNPTGSSDPDMLTVGDFNAYAQEDPIEAIENAGYTNLVTGDYSFVFSGQWGSLDHAFANGSLESQITGAAKWHINADEPDALDYSTQFNDPSLFNPNDEFRTSDHDPLVVGLDLSSGVVCNPTSGNDDLTGCATAGDDTVNALAGDDTVSGGEGQDLLLGSRGNDLLDGGTGDDTLNGGLNDDTLTGGDGTDRLLGSSGNDLLVGGLQGDRLFGSNGNDTLIGVDDSLTNPGAGEADVLWGQTGTDLFVLGNANGAFYVDGGTAAQRNSGRGVVADFDRADDTIQLAGSADNYQIVETTSVARIFYGEVGSPKNELVGVIRSDFSSLDLSASYFSYV